MQQLNTCQKKTIRSDIRGSEHCKIGVASSSRGLPAATNARIVPRRLLLFVQKLFVDSASISCNKETDLG